MDCQKYELDITETVNQIKEQDLMLFPALLYLLARVINTETGKVCHLSYPIVSGNGEIVISSLAYEADFASFYLKYLHNWLVCHHVESPSVEEISGEAERVHISFLAEDPRLQSDDGKRFILLEKPVEKEGRSILSFACHRFKKDFAPSVRQVQNLCDMCGSWLKHP